MLIVTVNFLDCNLLFYSDVEVLSAQPWGMGMGHSGTPLPPVVHVYTRKHGWNEAVRGQVLGWSPSPSASTSTTSEER